jgi:hypothetical protein
VRAPTHHPRSRAPQLIINDCDLIHDAARDAGAPLPARRARAARAAPRVRPPRAAADPSFPALLLTAPPPSARSARVARRAACAAATEQQGAPLALEPPPAPAADSAHTFAAAQPSKRPT